jgi:hypothetical protein
VVYLEQFLVSGLTFLGVRAKRKPQLREVRAQFFGNSRRRTGGSASATVSLIVRRSAFLCMAMRARPVVQILVEFLIRRFIIGITTPLPAIVKARFILAVKITFDYISNPVKNTHTTTVS